ncbi:MAG: Crp/Fnr family transcriptional regulator [Chlorobi bacterium]|jgi:CRP/FNR family transcriptional regulator|nr:Crp/Fnr family transcriptional regulator [Chlorobiota bacterium]
MIEPTSEHQLPPSVVADLLGAAIVRTFATGETITRPAEQPRSVPLVLDGAVKVLYCADSEDEELLLYYLEAEQYCTMSLLSAMRHVPTRLQIVAETDCRIAFIPVEYFLAALGRQPLLLEHLLVLYHKRIAELLDLVATLKFAGLSDRLVRLLARKAALTGSRTLHITHEELAHELGTSRVVVSRLLKELERRGLVHLGRGHIELGSAV